MPRPRQAAPALPSAWHGDRGGHLWPKDREVVLGDGTRVRYAVRGPAEAPWVVLTPGFLCPDNFWRDLAPELVRDHRVVMFNHRGIGASSEATGTALPPGAEHYTIPRLADDVAAVLDAEGAATATVLAHSMGVQVSLALWEQRPDLVGGMVLTAGTPGSPFRTMYGHSTANYLFPIVSMAVAAAPSALSRRVFRAIELPVARPVAVGIRAVAEHTPWTGMTVYRAHLSRVHPRTAIWTARGMQAHDAVPSLASITVPTSVIVGTRDGWCPASVGEIMASQIPEARLEVVPDASHTLPLEHPDVVLRHLRDVERRAARP